MRVLKVLPFIVTMAAGASAQPVNIEDCDEFTRLVPGSPDLSAGSQRTLVSGGYRVTHCIQNKSDNPIRVLWPDASLPDYYLPANDFLFNFDGDFDEDTFRTEESAIWYGSLRVEGETEIIYFDNRILPRIPLNVQVSRISFPTSENALAELFTLGEITDETLVASDFVIFQSRIFVSISESGRWFLEFSIEPIEFGPGDPLQDFVFSFDDEVINEALLFSTEGMRFSDWGGESERGDGLSVRAYQDNGFVIEAAIPPSIVGDTRDFTAQVLSTDGRTVSAWPVQFISLLQDR